MIDKACHEKLRVRSCDNHFRLVTERGIVHKETERFLRAIETRGLSQCTVRAYAFDLLILYRWMKQESLTVEALSQNDLVEFIRFQQVAKASPKTINRRLVVAELIYRFVTGEPMAKGNERGVSLASPYYKGRGKDRELGLQKIRAPLHRTLQVKMARKLVEPLTAEQARLLIGSFTRYRDISIAYLMLLCGLRSREVLAIAVNDVDFDEQRIRIIGKGGNERVLPLPALLLRYLLDYLRLERPTFCRARAFFTVLKGKRRGCAMTSEGLRSLFRYRRRDEKIENANPHRLRHTFGTDMARAGVRLHILQKMMGHEDSKTTLIYINLSMADISAEFQRAAKEIHKRYTEDK
jgi:integrase/recombinase XerC